MDRTRGVVRRWRSRRSDEALLFDSVLFDERWYSLQAGRELTRREAVRDYLERGRHSGLSPHPLFDAESLKLRWGAERVAGLGDRDPLADYLRDTGPKRSSHPLFDAEAYLRQVPAAPAHPAGPAGHYVETGLADGRSPAEWLPAGVDLRDWVVAAWTALSTEPLPAPSPPGQRVPGLVSVLVVADRADDVVGSVRRLAGVANEGTEIVVLDNGTSLVTAVSVRALSAYDGVRVVRVAQPLDRAAALARLAGEARGEFALLLGAGMRVPEVWAAPLRDALTDDVIGVQPLHLNGNGLIRSAGWVSGGGSSYPMLAGFPQEDAAGLDGHRIAVAATEAVLVRTADLEGALGDPLADGGAGDLHLARRLADVRSGGFVVAPTVAIAQRGPGPATTRPSAFAADRPADDAEAWEACGFDVEGHDADGPRVRWTGPERWALKNAAPAGPVGEVWGDTHFARSLARELRALGKHVVIDARPAWHRRTTRHDSVSLVIRGPEAFRPIEGQTTLAWVISHPTSITADELRSYDHVTAASVLWAERTTEAHGVPVEVMLQATDAALFHPDTSDPDSGPDLLFVGNTRGEYRHVVRDAIESGLPVTLVGRGWHEFLDVSRVAAFSIGNGELSAAYRAAGIVLSDHFEDMRRDGFIANRLFDAAASGARVITDEIAGLEGLFGESVQVYRTRDDLVRLATSADRDAVFGGDEERRAVADVVRREHSFAARARRFTEIADAVVPTARRDHGSGRSAPLG